MATKHPVEDAIARMSKRDREIANKLYEAGFSDEDLYAALPNPGAVRLLRGEPAPKQKSASGVPPPDAPQSVADADAKGAYVAAFGSDKGWLGHPRQLLHRRLPRGETCPCVPAMSAAVLNEMAAGEKKPDFVIGERLPGESFSEYWVRFRRADQR